MRVFSAEEVHSALPYDALIDHLRLAFRASRSGDGIAAPPRQHYSIERRCEDDGAEANNGTDARSWAEHEAAAGGAGVVGGEEGGAERGSGGGNEAEGRRQAVGTLLVMPAWDSDHDM
ncbi:hypothetical protein CLOP_g13240, partial [Closterium sp. NIES-67]